MHKLNKARPGKSTSTLGQLRIIGGQWRSRKLPVLNQPGLRPTPDRVRETLFNWLAADVAGSDCLDVFAGSGALGFEAASRGAQSVLLIEKQADAVAALQANKKTLQATQLEICRADALEFLGNQQNLQSRDQLFDIVFLDPPYQSALLEPAIRLLQPWLATSALVYVEMASDDEITMPDNWQQIKAKIAGQVHYSLYRIGGE